jgi:hypothetical protein
MISPGEMEAYSRALKLALFEKTGIHFDVAIRYVPPIEDPYQMKIRISLLSDGMLFITDVDKDIEPSSFMEEIRKKHPHLFV